jgi:hypothetical protein
VLGILILGPTLSLNCAGFRQICYPQEYMLRPLDDQWHCFSLTSSLRIHVLRAAPYVCRLSPLRDLGTLPLCHPRRCDTGCNGAQQSRYLQRGMTANSAALEQAHVGEKRSLGHARLDDRLGVAGCWGPHSVGLNLLLFYNTLSTANINNGKASFLVS